LLFFSPFCGGRGRRLAAQQLERLAARVLQRYPQLAQHLGRDPLLFAKQAQQQVLGADVAVVELACLGHGELQHLLGARRVRQLAQGDGRLAAAHGLFDLFLYLVEVHVEVVQNGGRHTLALADQAQQDVLGADVVVLEPDGLFAGHREHLAHAVGEIVVHLFWTSVPGETTRPTSAERPSLRMGRASVSAFSRAF
jgi:hypothetical protein